MKYRIRSVKYRSYCCACGCFIGYSYYPNDFDHCSDCFSELVSDYVSSHYPDLLS